MSISEFDRRMTVMKYIFGQAMNGGNVKALSSSFDIWCKFKPLNGSKYLENLQITYSKAFEITTRYESTRLLNETDEIVYDGFVYLIQSITKDTEGRKKYNVIVAYTTGTTSNEGDVIYSVQNVIHFPPSPGQTTLQDDKLIGWETILVFHDGVEYRITLSSPSPLVKEVQYDKNAGSLTFALPISATALTDVYLIDKTTRATGNTSWSETDW